MTKFFFDVHDGQTWLLDEEGSFFANREVASLELVAALREIVSGMCPSVTARVVRGAVRESDNEAFFTSRVELQSTWVDRRMNECFERG